MSDATRPSPKLLPLGEALDALARPDSAEIFSPLTGPGWLAVDLCDGVGSVARKTFAAAREALVSLPAPSIALRRGALSLDVEALARRFDVVVDEPSEVEALCQRVREHPLASMALVQLLRHGEGLGTEAGLVAESLVYATLQGGPEFADWLATREAKPTPRASPGPAVRVRRELSKLHLRLDRPEHHNAFSAEMRDALCEALLLASHDDSIDEVLLTGEGPSFSSGGDLGEFGSLPDPATAHAIRSTRNPARAMAACAERLHVTVHGACIGAGAELPAFARRVSARSGAFFQLPELSFGLVPGAGGTVSLPRRIGRQRTAWLALSGRRIDADTALAWGLVDRVID